MKRFSLNCASLFISRATLITTVLFLASPVQALPAGMIPPAPTVAAKSYILMDAVSGKVLVEKDSGLRLPPASLTKMMTAYVVENELASGRIHRDDPVLVSKKAWRMRGSLMFIEVGEKISVENLLKGVIIVSGNDASVALAEHVAGSEESFAQLMNATAQALGMKDSFFKNASGWPEEGHYTSARDLAVISKHIVYDHPDYYPIYREKEFQYGVNKKTGKLLKPQPNRNSLLWRNSSVDGLKTGHTDAAGYCLAVSAEEDGRRLIAVVMGTASEYARASETQKLLTYGFRFFENVDVHQGGIALENLRIWGGAIDRLPAGLSEDLIVTVPRGTGDKVVATVVFEENLEVPIQEGQKVGSIVVRAGDQVIEERDLIALQSVEQGGFLKRLWDSVVRFFSGLFN